MFKLFNRKLNKKGFTLAELLVVIAILAILIAIAVPVFSGMVADANLRVNQANVRSVRSAAVAEILTHPDKKGENGKKYNEGLAAKSGWIAVAAVNNNGDVSDLRIWVSGGMIDSYANGILITRPEDNSMAMGALILKNTTKDGFYEMKTNVSVRDPFATIKPSAGQTKSYTIGDTEIDSTNTYWVQAVITDLDLDN